MDLRQIMTCPPITDPGKMLDLDRKIDGNYPSLSENVYIDEVLERLPDKPIQLIIQTGEFDEPSEGLILSVGTSELIDIENELFFYIKSILYFKDKTSVKAFVEGQSHEDFFGVIESYDDNIVELSIGIPLETMNELGDSLR